MLCLLFIYYFVDCFSSHFYENSRFSPFLYLSLGAQYTRTEMTMNGSTHFTTTAIRWIQWRVQQKIIGKIKRLLYLKSANGTTRRNNWTICVTLINWIDANRMAIIQRSTATWWMGRIHRKKFVTSIYQSQIIVQAHIVMKHLIHGRHYDQHFVRHVTKWNETKRKQKWRERKRTYACTRCCSFVFFSKFYFVSFYLYIIHIYLSNSGNAQKPNSICYEYKKREFTKKSN